MALVKEFDRKLADLWRHRIASIESLVRKRVGKPKSFTKKKRDKGIRQLEELADAILTKEGAAEELAKVTSYQRRRQIKGWGIVARYERLIQWAEEHLNGSIVYAFWRGKKCLYVGKGDTWKRLESYKKSIYLKEATLLKVRGITSSSQIGKAECLATHLYKPRDKENDPAKKKWGKACPICKAKKQMKTELKSLFRLK